MSSEKTRWFEITAAGNAVTVKGSDQAAEIAGRAYWERHQKLGHAIALPLRREAPWTQRLITEDFPFDCYQPTGFDFDLDTYAKNLAELGFSAMECNRFSPLMPVEPYHESYRHTNPSLAPFFKTRWHGDVWSDAQIEANHAELARTIDAACRYGLEPTVTVFLPRPYPEKFFALHPDWRGRAFASGYFERGGHRPVYALNTDLPEVQDFYRELFARLLDDFPRIRHLFFWHADLGSSFWHTGEGEKGKTLAGRIGAFHKMLQEEIQKRALPVKVWMNPWAIGTEEFQALADHLPPAVGFTIKDTPGLDFFANSVPSPLHDAAIVRASLGTIPLTVRAEATRTGRPFCLGQYLDFSEDLDPLLGLPHPMMTYRKFRTLHRLPCDAAAAHWGILSPELTPHNLNQAVIREMNWGEKTDAFADLLPRILPKFIASNPERLERFAMFLQGIDDALRLWPQYWGLRFQDLGLRCGWLLRPFGDHLTPAEVNPEWLLKRQIYHVAFDRPHKAFMSLTDGEVTEVGRAYRQMLLLVEHSLEELALVQADTAEDEEFLQSQRVPVQGFRLLLRTFGNLFSFYGSRDPAMRKKFVAAESLNAAEIARFIEAHPRAFVIAKTAWGQCLGHDAADRFREKSKLMQVK